MGKTLKVNLPRAMREQGKFARIEGSKKQIEYESIHLLRFCCGRYGRVREPCTLKNLEAGSILSKKEGENRRQTEEGTALVSGDQSKESE